MHNPFNMQVFVACSEQATAKGAPQFMPTSYTQQRKHHHHTSQIRVRSKAPQPAFPARGRTKPSHSLSILRRDTRPMGPPLPRILCREETGVDRHRKKYDIFHTIITSRRTALRGCRPSVGVRYIVRYLGMFFFHDSNCATTGCRPFTYVWVTACTWCILVCTVEFGGVCFVIFR